jgi:hypothetical protein
MLLEMWWIYASQLEEDQKVWLLNAMRATGAAQCVPRSCTGTCKGEGEKKRDVLLLAVGAVPNMARQGASTQRRVRADKTLLVPPLYLQPPTARLFQVRQHVAAAPPNLFCGSTTKS